MNIIDNFNEIRKHLIFEDKDDFYFIQIIQRKKDGCFTESGNNGYRVIKSYYIDSLEKWDRREPKIKELCESNHARAYININRRNSREVCYEIANASLDYLHEDRTHQIFGVIDHACRISKSKDKFWMIDVDDKDMLDNIILLVNNCRGKNEDHVKFIIPTKAGYHIITEKFDIKEFKEKSKLMKIGDVDIHKQGIILLYFNET